MPRRVPTLCGPRADGRYYVTDPATGRPVYLGTDRGAAEEAYERWRIQFLARAPGAPPEGCTVAELAAAFLRHAETHYVKGGRPTSEPRNFRGALGCLAAWAHTPAADFGPQELRAARAVMLAKGWHRRTINGNVRRVRHAWRWAAQEGLVPPGCVHGLAVLLPLQKGRTTAPEGGKVRAVKDGVLEATLPYLGDLYRRLVLVHRHSGMRALEVVALRPCDLDRLAEPWLYRVPEEGLKLAHQEDVERVVPLGPRARAALLPLVDGAAPGDWLFPRRAGGHVLVRDYRDRVSRAVGRANRARAKQGLGPLPHWTPLMVRHRALTEVRARHGLEAAAAIGGHARLETTAAHYAERNRELAQRVAEEMG